jgi:hypothetical protein
MVSSATLVLAQVSAISFGFLFGEKIRTVSESLHATEVYSERFM